MLSREEMSLSISRLGSELQNRGRNGPPLHPAALCEAPDVTQLFPWPQSDVGMKY